MKLQDYIQKGMPYEVEIVHVDHYISCYPNMQSINLIQFLQRNGIQDLPTLQEVAAYPCEISIDTQDNEVLVAHHGQLTTLY